MEMKEINWKDSRNFYTLQARNVGSLNTEAAIQLELEILPQGNGRTKRQSISIPLNKVTEFLEAIK